MQATIEHLQEFASQRRGFFGTKTQITRGNFVKLKIALTDAERAVLEGRKLWHYVLIQIPNEHYEKELIFYKDQQADWKIEEKMRPLITAFRTPPEAPKETFQITIANVCSPEGYVRYFDTPGAAKNWADKLREYLKTLKEVIDHNAELPRSQTFTL